MVFGPLLLAALLPLAAQAANDWSKPCFGQCNWDINTGSGSGTVQLAGTQSGISDLTTAAGWTILDCDSQTADQDIRLVCHDPSKGCDHVTQDGAAGTIVRLPQSCASVPFALVTRHWVHANQSIPANKRSLLTRRDGSTPKVMGTTLSTAFANGNHTAKGNVTMFLQGSSVSGAAGNFTRAPPSQGHHSKRSVLSWVGKTLKNLAQVHKTLNGSSPISFSKDVPLFDKSISCPQNGKIPGFTGEATVDLNAAVNGTVHYGVAAAGTLVPPDLQEFGLFVGLDMDLLGTLGLDTTLTGSIDTGLIPLFTTGIPGLDFPGLFSIGPTFTVNAEGTATLDADIKTDVDIDYKIMGAELFFPPQGTSAGSFTPGDSNVQLSVTPGVTSQGQIAAHLIPTLSFGISALAGKAKATINLDVDGEAAVDLTLSAADLKSSESFGGCVDITSGLTVSASADADFLSIFDKSTSVDLFQKTFDLFKKCFGSSARRRRAHGGRADSELGVPPLAKRAGLSCPASALGDALSIATTKVSGSSLQ
ncbi:hypothetical protein LXA43DRAFT_703234 [Ganoderma leucocontextum]|nr:hypothetical protein LXA43DRAFT_703234 [Ganoderma leucocontextum]